MESLKTKFEGIPSIGWQNLRCRGLGLCLSIVIFGCILTHDVILLQDSESYDRRAINNRVDGALGEVGLVLTDIQCLPAIIISNGTVAAPYAHVTMAFWKWFMIFKFT